MKKFFSFLIFVSVLFFLSGCLFDSEYEYVITAESVLPDEIIYSTEAIIRTVNNQEDLEENWDYFNLNGNLPTIDWTNTTLLFLGTNEASGCPIVIEDMIIDNENSSLGFKYKEYENCELAAAPKTIVIEVKNEILEQVTHIEFDGNRVKF